MTQRESRIEVLFVCLGNICRSPMAEAVFRHHVVAAGLADQITVASAGTGDWHIGQPAHRGTLDVLHRAGIEHQGRARQVVVDDVAAADYVVAMDSDNHAALRRLDRTGVLNNKLMLLLDETPHAGVRDVPDPYYEDNFDEVYALVDAACRGLLDRIRCEHNL